MASDITLEQLTAEWDPELQKAFLDAVYNLRDAAQVDLIVQYLEQGDIDSALAAVNLDEASLHPYLDALRDIFIAGGVATSLIFPSINKSGGLQVKFQFNVRNPQAERWLSQYSSQKVTEILADQQAMVRTYLTDALARGINPRQAALDLVGRINKQTGEREGGLLGLTDSQEGWVAAYENELRSLDSNALDRLLRDKRFDSTVLAAINSGNPLSEDQIATLVATYKNRALRWRAGSIARTEMLTALHAGQQQAIAQATQAGVNPQDISFIWRATNDLRTRPSHAAMDGQAQPFGTPFRSGLGNFLAYPGDPKGPPEDVINCFPGNTTISTLDATNIYRREYSGKLIKISTRSGRCLSGTPNHPILSRRGWVPLCEVKEGDDLLCYRVDDRSASSVVNPNIKYMPASFEEIFDSNAIALKPKRVVGLPMDFHGDGSYCNVDVVFSGWLLRLNEVPTKKAFELFERSQDFGLIFSNNSRFSQCATDQLIVSASPPPYREMGSADLMTTSRVAHSGPLNSLGFGAASDGDIFINQDRPNYEAANSKLLSRRLLGIAAQVELGNSGGDLFSSGSTCNAFPISLVTWDTAVGVGASSYSGHVFNLESEHGFYIANDFIVHNCRCWLEPRIDFLAGIQ